uniref:Uncharacterized protein n=1 Tax=Avena sativa TaxID=4498 RepID=A0ACD5ZKM7_AVESA
MDNPADTEDEKGLNFPCSLCDAEVVHSMTKLLLPALATASVDNTTGDMFKGPSSVVAGLKTELAGYMIQRSETLVRESTGGQEDRSEQFIKASTRPAEFLPDLIEDFVTSKKNMLSHVSGFFSTDGRINKIKEFTQKLETEKFWAEDERKATTETILKIVDVECNFHCSERFDMPDKLLEHTDQCKFRIVNCTNDGCAASFSAIHIEKHDSVCPFKLIPCEQLCEQDVMRSKMDKHCSTVCPMKLINCPFYEVGCETAFAQCSLERHCSGFLQTHLMYVAHVIIRQRVSVNDMDQRLQLLEKVQSLNELSGALDVRTLTVITKEQEAKINKLEKDLKAQETKMKKLENDLKSRK